MSDAFKPSTPTRRNMRVHHEVMVGVTSEHGTFTGWHNASTGGYAVTVEFGRTVSAAELDRAAAGVLRVASTF